MRNALVGFNENTSLMMDLFLLPAPDIKRTTLVDIERLFRTFKEKEKAVVMTIDYFLAAHLSRG